MKWKIRSSKILMEAFETIAAQVALPRKLYEALEQQAKAHGCSMDNEIAARLPASLALGLQDLEHEIAQWEAASDEDYLNLEALLSNEAQ
jgi:Arc-like DNA binding domain